MRTLKTLFATILFMLLLMLSVPMLARADDEDEADEYDVTARVVRVSLLGGEVKLRRAGSQEWERATLNLPLAEGDTLATGRDARLEIQIDARNYVRVQADSMLRIVTLREDGIALSLSQGTATLRLARFDRAKEFFEIDAPKTTMAAEHPGLYRLDVGREGGVRLTVREGGQARIYSQTSGFTLRDGRSAELVASGTSEGDWQLSAASASDDWDTWVLERERYLAARLRYDERERYYDSDIWGAEELDAYGDWINAGDYGWVWRPSPTVTNNYNNWAPYRHGQWRWFPPYGWTWIGDEPWGWAPYHYGRWVYYNGRWCWAPRGQGSTARRNWWRPALVAIVIVATPSEEQVAWYPLDYGQHDPYRRNRRNRRRNDRHPPRSHDRDNPRRGNPHWRGGVSSVPSRNFGRETARPQPAPPEVARRAETSDPVPPRLPISRPDAEGVATRDRPLRPRTGAERPTREVPSATIPERDTGAADREPGRPLDEELQRRRLFNGHNPLPRVPAQTTTNPADRSTGAVERPAPITPRPRPDRDGDGGERDRRYRNDGTAPVRPVSPERPSEPAPGSAVEPVAPEQRESAPAIAPQTEAPSPSVETTAPPAERPERRERPEGIDRPARPERPAPVDREEPAERSERRSERQEAPAQSPEAPVQRQEQQTIQPEPTRIEPSTPEPRPEPPAPQPEPAAPAPEPPAAQPAPPTPQPEPPAPREEAPPPAREEPPQQVETPSPPPSPPPPPPEPPSPPAEAPREREVAPERPAENDRVRTPVD